MGIEIGGKIEKVNGKELSYSEFVERYMEKNQPVVLTGLMDDWRAVRDWVIRNGQPNLQFFSSHFGSSKVQVFIYLSVRNKNCVCSYSFSLAPPLFLEGD